MAAEAILLSVELVFQHRARACAQSLETSPSSSRDEAPRPSLEATREGPTAGPGSSWSASGCAGNTLRAFQLALTQGADGVELDVRLAADSERW